MCGEVSLFTQHPQDTFTYIIRESVCEKLFLIVDTSQPSVSCCQNNIFSQETAMMIALRHIYCNKNIIIQY